MDCPYCGGYMRYVQYVTQERDHKWWCVDCGEDVWHSEVQALRREQDKEMRAALRRKLAANREDEGGN